MEMKEVFSGRGDKLEQENELADIKIWLANGIDQDTRCAPVAPVLNSTCLCVNKHSNLRKKFWMYYSLACSCIQIKCSPFNNDLCTWNDKKQQYLKVYIKGGLSGLLFS